MPLTREKKKLNKLIQESDSEESDHELSYYVNDRIKLMKEVLKTIKPKKIKMMAPSCLRNTDSEEINSMLLEELLGISNKRLKYIFNGQSLDEDSSSSSSEDKPIDVISLDDISDDDLVINIDDDEGTRPQKKRKKESKHHTCKKEKTKNSMKSENDNKKPNGEEGMVSSKNLMSVLELLELQARARAIKSQLLLENAKTQENLTMSKIPTHEEKVGSDDEVIIKTAKTEEIVITSSESEDEDVQKKESQNKNKVDEKEPDNNMSKTVVNNEEDKNETGTDITQNNDDKEESPKIKIIENKELPSADVVTIERGDNIESNDKKANEEPKEQNIENNGMEISDVNKEKPTYNDEIIQINLSDDEIEEMK